jgi:hypothetical protein
MFESHKNKRRSKGGKRGGIIPGSKNYGNSTTVQQLTTPIFPAKVTKRLRYSTNFPLTTTVGAVSSYVFSANGLFDPDITGTGHQPMGFDQLMVSYNHYIVTHANITVIARNNTTSTPTVSVTVSPSPTPITSIDRIVEFGGNTMEVLEFKGVDGSSRVITAAVDIRKIQGVTNVVDDPTLRGDAATNPTEQTYFHVQTWDTAGVNGSVLFDVIIDYTSVFNEPRVLTISVQSKLKQLILEEMSIKTEGKEDCACSFVRIHKNGGALISHKHK